MTPSPPSTELIVGAIALLILGWWAWKMVDKYWPADRLPPPGSSMGE